QAAHKPGSDRIAREEHHNGNRRCRRLESDHFLSPNGDDEIELRPDEVNRQPRKLLGLPIGEPIFDDQILAFDVTKLSKSLLERYYRTRRIRQLWPFGEIPHPPHLLCRLRL